MSYARSAVTRMTLDMSRLDLQRSETVTQGDTNRRWEVTLINGGAPFRLPPNWTAALTGIKPDGKGLLNGCSVADGKIIYDFAAGKEISTCVGSYPVQFDIWDDVGELVASPKVYVNVLADVRPHAELESDGQYTQIGVLIGRVNQTDEDVDLLAKNVLEQGTDIADLKKKITTAGTITIPASEWTDTTPRVALITIPEAVKGTVVIIMPYDDVSQTVAKSAKLYAAANVMNGQIRLVRADDDYAPMLDISLSYIVIKTGGDKSPMVFLGGVDSYGEEGGASGGVDAEAVKALIREVVPAWARESKPPEDAVKSVNDQTGEVTISIPKTASDVGAEDAGAVNTHNNSQTAHPYILKQVDDALSRIGDHDTAIEGINKSVAERLKTSELASKLDAYKAAQGLISSTANNLANYYLKNEVYTKDEVAAMISAIPKFEIKVVTSLPTSNISQTTVYLVKDTTEGGGLYTEYIYTGSEWEELGNQTVDLAGYVTEEGLNNILEGYATLTRVAELIANALKPYATAEEMAEAIRVATVNLVTGSQVTTAITTALSAYYTSAQVDAKIQTEIANSLKNYLTAAKAAELYQPKGNYLTQHQSLAHLLPKNQGAEHAGKIMAVAADGSVTYISVSDLGVSGDLVGNFADDGSIVLITPLDVGIYDLYTEDGRLYGKMTVEAAKAKYTVTFMADGVPVDVVEYTEGDATLLRVPTVPEKDGYNGVWEAYDLSLGGDITVNAIYTAIPVEPEFTNLIDEAGYTVGKRISDSANGGEVTSGASKLVLTGHIPVGQYGDVFHVRGVDSLIAPLPSGTADQAGLRSCWDANKVYIDNTVKSYPRELAGTDENGDLTLTYTEAWEVPEGTAYIRMQFYDADGSVPSLIVTRNELIPK